MERDWGFGGLWHGLQSRSAIHNPGCAITRKIYGNIVKTPVALLPV